MTDLLQGTSAFKSLPSAFDTAGGSSFDASKLDSNIKAITAVERTWRSPGLPAEVKLDLAAMPGVDAGGLQGFLRGVDSDYNDFEEDPPVENELPEIQFDRTDSSWGRTTLEDIQVVLAGVAGEPHPLEPTSDANQIFKKEAIERGFLPYPENGRVDSSWSPEMNQVAWEMSQAEYNDRISGARDGAVPMTGENSVSELLGDWLSPGGLLAAATELDLFWDVGAIKNEFSTWGDKIRAVGDSSNPIDFAKNLVDAATGPLDDLAMPVISWVMVFSGVGAFGVAGRAGAVGARAARAGSLSRLYRPQSIEVLKRPSGIATRLMGPNRGVVSQSVGNGLKTWRAYTPVARTKQVVGSGMRIGATAKIQDSLTPGEGGWSPSDIGVVGSFRDKLRSTADNPAFLPVELAFSPQNIFLPGTFFGRKANGANLIGGAGSNLVKGLGFDSGRAVAGGVVGAGAGAIGGEDMQDVLAGAAVGSIGLGKLPAVGKLASRNLVATQGVLGAGIGVGVTTFVDEDFDALDLLKGAAIGGALSTGVAKGSSWARRNRDSPGAVSKAIGFVADAAQKLDYRPLATNMTWSAAFDSAFKRTLSADKKAIYMQGWQDTGTQLGAMKALIGTSDDNQTAAYMAFIVKSARLDHAARVFAKGGGDEVNWAAYHFYRDKLTSQSRMFDMEDDITTILDEVAAAHAWSNSGRKQDFVAAFENIRSTWQKDDDGRAKALEWVTQHNIEARKLNQQLMTPEIIPDLDESIDFAERLYMKADVAENGSVIEAYLMEDVEFMRWNQFTTQTGEIARFDGEGILDAAQVVPAYSISSGAELSYKGYAPSVNPSAVPVEKEVMDLLFRDPSVDITKLRGGRFSPLARSNPFGRFTVMRAGTYSAGQLVSLKRDLEELLDIQESLLSMNRKGISVQKFEDRAGSIQDMDDAAVVVAVKMLGGSSKINPSAKRVAQFARRLKISGSTLDEAVEFRIAEIMEDGDLWNQTGVNRFVRDSEDKVLTGAEAMRRRIKQLKKSIQYTAAEVDLVALAKYHDEVGDAARAAEVRVLADGLAGDGYKLVHGVEFSMPHDLVEDTMHFGTMTTQNMHSATMGNFFKGRLPAAARASDERRHRVALATAFQKAGFSLAPESGKTGDLLADLRSILKEEQTSIAQRLRKVADSPKMIRPLTYVSTSISPMRLEDLASRKKMVLKGLESRGWVDAAEREAAWVAIWSFRNTEFKDMGLYALEAWMRSRSVFTDALHVIGGSKRFSANRSLAGAGMGGGIAAAQSVEGEDDANLGRTLLYGAAGAAGAPVVGAAARKLIPATERIRYGYMADYLVRARDTLRFTMSPFFDLSRYTEGQMLGQAAAPLRTPAGETFIMPVNASPSKLKRMLKSDPATNPDGSTVTFDGIREEFKAQAMGDFDIDVLDDAGKWFAQVGILGFNPTDWMATAFGHMRKAGFAPEDAYRNAREMYTYGTRGRSAAELSVNFIFFPFSFQKKALGHLTEFLADDLGRSLILHDAMKSYELIDEKYDLDTMWRDHIPVLRNLKRLNMFAFGISPGRFGGINAQPAESASRLALETLFAPQGVSIRHGADKAELEKLWRSALPVLNDMQWMMRDLKEQGHVLLDESHMTTPGQIRDGYDEWNSYKEAMVAELDRRGLTLADMHNKNYLAGVKFDYESRRAEIGSKYPAWAASRRESTGEIVKKQMERSDRIDLYKSNPAAASADDEALAQFDKMLDELKDYLNQNGYDIGGDRGWSDAPPEATNLIMVKAVKVLEDGQVPGWKSIWEKFYRKEFGLLEAKI